MSSLESTTISSDAVLMTTIRDLTDRYPETMAVLSAHGLDLCCGGGHRLGEALALHGIDQESILPDIQRLVDLHTSDV